MIILSPLVGQLICLLKWDHSDLITKIRSLKWDHWKIRSLRSAYSNEITQMWVLNTTDLRRSWSLLHTKSINLASNLHTQMRSLKLDHNYMRMKLWAPLNTLSHEWKYANGTKTRKLKPGNWNQEIQISLLILATLDIFKNMQIGLLAPFNYYWATSFDQDFISSIPIEAQG